MKMIHTADWHLCDRLGAIDRSAGLRQRVEHVARYCEEHRVDVLAIAGDLFAETARPDEMAEALNHLHKTFRPFFDRGGTILAVTGNHDRDDRIDLVRAGMLLAAPPVSPGQDLRPGRMYLLNRRFYATLCPPGTNPVQFVFLPYPFAHRYDLPATYRSREELNRLLQAQVADWLRQTITGEAFRRDLPSVLIAHLHLTGANLNGLYRLTPRDDVQIDPGSLEDVWAYVALGHIHQPQVLPGRTKARYSGPLDRLDFGEKDDDRGVWLVEIGPTGLASEPQWLPLEPTRFVDLIGDPATIMATPVPTDDKPIIRVTLTKVNGPHDLVTQELRQKFSQNHLHEIRYPEEQVLAASPDTAAAPLRYNTAQLAETVRHYLERAIPADDPDRQELLELAEHYIAQEQQSQQQSN